MSKIEEPVSFAVNVITNKQSIEMQKLAFKFGYKWVTDTEYFNNVDETVFQGYGKHTCFVFDYKKRFISFCKMSDLRHFPNTLFFYFSEMDVIIKLFKNHQHYWEQQDFEASLLQSDIKDRMIL